VFTYTVSSSAVGAGSTTKQQLCYLRSRTSHSLKERSSSGDAACVQFRAGIQQFPGNVHLASKTREMQRSPFQTVHCVHFSPSNTATTTRRFFRKSKWVQGVFYTSRGLITQKLSYLHPPTFSPDNPLIARRGC